MLSQSMNRCAMAETSTLGMVSAGPRRAFAGVHVRRVVETAKRAGRSRSKVYSDSIGDHGVSGRSGSNGPASRLKPVQATGISCEPQLVVDAQSELLSIDDLPSPIAAGPAKLHQLSNLVAELSDMTSALASMGSLSDPSAVGGDSQLLTAEDAGKLADARTKHHQEEEDRKQRRRLERERRRASKEVGQGPGSTLEESFSDQQISAAERSQPASTSARDLDSEEVATVVSNARRKARGKVGLKAASSVRRSGLSGAQASAAARSMGQASWGRTAGARDNPWFELKGAKQRKTKNKVNYVVASNPGLRSAQKYLKLSEHPLLSAEEEKLLSSLVQRQIHYEEKKAGLETELSRDITEHEWAAACNCDRAELANALAAGKSAKKQMVDSNVRLVVSIAKKYSRVGGELGDIISDGIIGLTRAVEKFDARKGFRFSTYAHWWIRQAINRSITECSRPIRIPAHLFEVTGKLHRLERELHEELGRQPKCKELAERANMKVDKVEKLMLVWRKPVSFDTCLGGDDEDGMKMEDFVEDADAPSAEGEADELLVTKIVEDVLHTLNERERGVLLMRYGLNGMEPQTLEEVGAVYQVTRERIRQIEQKAISKLRQPSRSKPCMEYCAAHGSSFDVPVKARNSKANC